jgi:hypothetical protein
VAVGHSVEPALWRAETDRLLERMAGRFARVETRHRTRGFLLGLLADLPRKNCWTIAHDRTASMVDLLVGCTWIKSRFALAPVTATAG